MKQVIFGDAAISQSICTWVSERAGGSWVQGQATAIGLMEDGELIAGVVFDSWNGASCCMHVAAAPGKAWMTPSYLKVCFAYPFNQLGVNKILGLVGSKNEAALQFDLHLGFVPEATLEGAHPDGALIVLSMTRAQCRWLPENRHGKTFSTAATRLSGDGRAAGHGEPRHRALQHEH